MMESLFSTAGVDAMRHLAANWSVLSFDLDGSLAPLMDRPDDAQVPRRLAAHMRELSGLWPVAVITGRQVHDAHPRLGFKPHYLVGNHGAEPAMAVKSARVKRLSLRLEPCRELLCDHLTALRAHRIRVEDKGFSLALHYRLAGDAAAARRWLDSLLAVPGLALCKQHGQFVLNITPLDAPDKGDALLDILRHCGASRALFVGDDANDESAFAKAPAGSVSVRIAPPLTPTRARFCLSSQAQVEPLLRHLLDLRR